MIHKLRLAIIIGSLTLTHCGLAPELASKTDILNNQKYQNPFCTGSDSETTEGYGGGDGTKENPYLVCTVEHFKSIEGDMGKKRFFKLTADLDFESEGALRMLAIAPFASIDGKNHKIKNLTLQHGHGFKDSGLFGQLLEDGKGNQDEIKNLIIENVKLIGDGKEDAGGVIASNNWGGIISNVHITGKVQIEYPDAHPYFWGTGGIVGKNSSLIENSSFDGEISGIYNVGGIAGINEGIIRNCNSSGTIRGLDGTGGIVGVQLKSGKIENNQSNATINANQHYGALAGLLCEFDDYSKCMPN